MKVIQTKQRAEDFIPKAQDLLMNIEGKLLLKVFQYDNIMIRHCHDNPHLSFFPLRSPSTAE